MIGVLGHISFLNQKLGHSWQSVAGKQPSAKKKYYHIVVVVIPFQKSLNIPEIHT